jgi:glycosyltransferase involved in cell wall biosynthesis
MRLLILNQFYAPDISPTAQLAASLAEHRASEGDEVTVITSRWRYRGRPLDDHPDVPGVRVIRLPLPGLGRDRALGQLVDYLAFGALATLRAALLARQDVAVAMTTPPFLVLAAIAHRIFHRRSRVVLWNMDSYPDAVERFGAMRPGGAASRVFRALKRWVFGRIDHVVVLDEAMRELVLGGAPSSRALRVTRIPNWERAALFPRDALVHAWDGYDTESLREHFVVLYLGNVGRGHRLDTVVAAAEKLEHEDVAFLFVGGGPRLPDLEAARRGATNIVLHPYVPKDETPAVMAGAGAALIALDDNALGVMSPSKLHAYLAMGLPIIYVGPAGSNVDEALARYGCGRSVRQGDVDGLVDAIRSLRNPATRAALGAHAREAFDDAYSDLRTLPQWDAILDELA